MSKLLKLAAKERPARLRRSKLDPHLEDLKELKSRGFTLDQMVELLEKLNVKVSKQGLHDFLKRRTQEPVNK